MEGHARSPDGRAPRRLRLTRRQDITRVFDRGTRAADGRITLLGAASEEWTGPARLAVAVPKRCGKAVLRNRLKRLCREAFRLMRGDLPAGWDFVIVPRAGAACDLAGLQKSIRALTRRVLDRAQPPPAPPAEGGGA